MSDPERLLDGPLPPEVESLLRSAESDDPREVEDKRDRLLAAAATSAPWASSRPRTASGSAFRSAGRIGLAAAVIAGASLGIGMLWSSSTPTTSSVPNTGLTAPTSPDHAPRALASSSTESATAAPVAVPSLHVEDLPSAAAPPSARPSTASAANVRGEPPAPSVEDELATIDAARGALAARRPQETLARVQRYRVVFPAPHFVAEADALEVQALAALGHSEEARAKAEQFFRAHPGSPYTQRVRSATSAPAREE